MMLALKMAKLPTRIIPGNKNMMPRHVYIIHKVLELAEFKNVISVIIIVMMPIMKLSSNSNWELLVIVLNGPYLVSAKNPASG